MKKIKSINPATGELNEEFDHYSSQAVSEKLKISRKAFSDWKNESIDQRCSSIQEVAKVLRGNKKELAEIITNEMGKPIKESIAEIEKCAWTCDYFSKNVENFLEPEFVESDAKSSCYVFEPAGVVLSIMPWNFPFWQALRFGIPALAGGNTVLLKHASSVPMCALEIEKIFIKAGLPEGTYQTILVNGETASSLIAKNEINAVSFTGSRPAGEKVAQAAGGSIKKFILELGGSDPFIVMDDADIPEAAKAAVTGRFQNCGQSCIAAKRLLINENVMDDFTELFLKNIDDMKIGDPMDSDTDIGPMSSEKQRQILDKQVTESLRKGANVLLEGGMTDEDGFFYLPTVLNKINREAPVVTEETFGPVAPIITFKDDNEAIKIANNTEFGLGASIWSRDQNRSMRVAKQVEAGVIAINSIVSSDPRLPFGGMKKAVLAGNCLVLECWNLWK